MGDQQSRLSRREEQVLALLLNGHTNSSAGAALGIVGRTVEIHRRRIMAKLGARTPAHLGWLCRHWRPAYLPAGWDQPVAPFP